MAAEGPPVQVACRVLGVSECAYYAWRKRSRSARAVRHVWLTDRIRAVHTASRGTYGAQRVRAEMVLGQGIGVGHQAVEQLMCAAVMQGLSGRPRYRKSVPKIRAACRRHEISFERVLRHGPIELNRDTREVFLNGSELTLTVREFGAPTWPRST
jgi:hypothetical protein